MTDVIYRLEQASVTGPDGLVLAPFNWEIYDHEITLLLGPPGAGKSTLMRAMSGRPPRKNWSFHGQWWYRGSDLREAWAADKPASGLAWVPQIKHAPAGAYPDDSEAESAWSRIDMALYSGARTLLLDEPTRGLMPQRVDELVDRLRDRCEQGSSVVVTHDLGFARTIGHRACLLYAGECVAQVSVEQLFEDPPNEMAAQFARSGSCAPPLWPSPTPPRSFFWLPGMQVAGMGQPGLLGDLDDDLLALAAMDISTLITLTEQPLPAARLRPFGLFAHHVPLRDMGTPSMSATHEVCRIIERSVRHGDKVAVHCRAGLGRTGTMLACWLVSTGRDPHDSIDAVRDHAPGAIQTSGQEQFVFRWAEGLRR